jgi:uncharacterized protein (DUF1330 family)
MAKGYWIVSVDISNPESHKMYVAETRSAFRKYGARFVVRGGKSEVAEGKGRSRIVVIEFKDYATALECYRSPSTPRQLKSVRAVLWLTSLSLRAITARSRPMGNLNEIPKCGRAQRLQR